MSTTAVETARRFAAILDRREYDMLHEVLSPDCRYEFRGGLAKGKAEIIEVYRKNTEWAFEVFERIEFDSDVVFDSPNSAQVSFTDHLFRHGETHHHKCQQLIEVGDDGRITRIEHVDLPGQREALSLFLQQVGISNPNDEADRAPGNDRKTDGKTNGSNR